MGHIKREFTGFYHSELFRDIEEKAKSAAWLPSEIEWEAWLVDTISLISDNFPEAILVGGSGARNLTNVHRLTYDVDFDTKLSSLKEIQERVIKINQVVVGKRTPEEGLKGAITPKKPGNSLKAKFYGANQIAVFTRWVTPSASVKLDIMCVTDDLSAYTDAPVLDIKSPFKHGYTARNAPRNYLVYRKAKRALEEVRVEDFLDIPFLYETASPSDKQGIINYCGHKDRKKIVVNGLNVLKMHDFSRDEISPRLAHVSVDNIDVFIIKVKDTLDAIISKIDSLYTNMNQ